MNLPVPVFVDHRSLVVPAATTVAAAIVLAGGEVTRRSVTGAPRAPLCGMGTCMECRVTINGAAHQRACQTEVRPGMIILTSAGGQA